MRSFRFALVAGAAMAVLATAPLGRAADIPNFFDEGKAQAALEKIFDQAKHPKKALSVDIRAYSLAVELQDPDAPKHIDGWTDDIETGAIMRYLKSETVAGPRAVDPALINPDLDANLFDLKPSDLAIVSKMVDAAAKRAQLEDPVRDARLTLKRSLHLIPTPSSGPPEWEIELSSGRERATVYADISGKLTHANFDGTRRAQALNYLAGGKDLDDVVALVADTLGKEPVIKSVSVSAHSIAIVALNPDHPDRDAQFSAGLNGVYRDLLLDSVVNMQVPGRPAPGRFAIGDVDWPLLPKLQDAARSQLELPGGRVTRLQLSKPSTGVGDAAIQWEIGVESATDPASDGYVVFDAAGKVLHTKYPPGKGPKLDLFDAAGYAASFDALSHSLGEHAPSVELRFDRDRLLATVKDPKDPGKDPKDPGAQIVFEYHGEALSRSIMPPLNWPTFGPDWFFDLAQAQPIAGHWAGMQQDALTRLGLAGGKIERITISKQKLFMPRNDRVLIEVRAEAGNRNGRVVYDTAGKVVDIVKP